MALSKSAQTLLKEITDAGYIYKVVQLSNIDLQPRTNKRFYRAMEELRYAKLVDVRERFCEQRRSTFDCPSLLINYYNVRLGTGTITYCPC